MTKPKPLPSQERLQELFEYSVTTGTLYRKKGVRGSAAGRSVGCVNSTTGYVVTCIDQRHYQMHRVIWKMVTGVDPVGFDIDHSDGDRTNNAWHNLRLSTRRQNNGNQRLRSNNTSGLKGVSRDSFTGRWVARINTGTAYRNLGRYDTPEEAHAAYLAAAEQVHGEFARAA